MSGKAGPSPPHRGNPPSVSAQVGMAPSAASCEPLKRCPFSAEAQRPPGRVLLDEVRSGGHIILAVFSGWRPVSLLSLRSPLDSLLL